jgi:hypothetical protein
VSRQSFRPPQVERSASELAKTYGAHEVLPAIRRLEALGYVERRSLGIDQAPAALDAIVLVTASGMGRAAELRRRLDERSPPRNSQLDHSAQTSAMRNLSSMTISFIWFRHPRSNSSALPQTLTHSSTAGGHFAVSTAVDLIDRASSTDRCGAVRRSGAAP